MKLPPPPRTLTLKSGWVTTVKPLAQNEELVVQAPWPAVAVININLHHPTVIVTIEKSSTIRTPESARGSPKGTTKIARRRGRP